MKEANLNSDNLAKSFSGLNPLMENLGQSAGELSRVFLDFANKIGLNVGKGQTLPDAVYNTVVDGSANSAADWLKYGCLILVVLGVFLVLIPQLHHRCKVER
jgi:ABC-type molybdate transport system permease subunit